MSYEFVGRKSEVERLMEVCERNEASIVIVHGRRRVGKTTLVEHVFSKRNLLKLEGIEGGGQRDEISALISQLSEQLKKPSLKYLKPQSWLDFFEVLKDHIGDGVDTLYFEEVQWIANYRADFAAALKYAWDNFLSRKRRLIVILCGSSPSFMIHKIVRSKALYNRSQHLFALKPFSLYECLEFFGKGRSPYEILDGYLLVGGVPEYLKYLRSKSSILQSLAAHAFLPDSFFLNEYEKIFVSSLAKNPDYRTVVEFLSKRKIASAAEIAKRISCNQGGGLSSLLLDLEESGFVSKYIPYSLQRNSKLLRYAISDSYLYFYYNFIRPIEGRIQEGAFKKYPVAALDEKKLKVLLGLAFERYCRTNTHTIATMLGISAINYKAGPFFNRASLASDGSQVDLCFDRPDKVITVCEIKYHAIPVGKEVIRDFERKLKALSLFTRKSVEKVLITVNGVNKALKSSGYFHRIFTLDDIIRADQLAQ